MIQDAFIDSVDIVKDNIGMDDRDYQRVLQHLLNYGIADFNYQNSQAPVSLNSTSKFEPVAKEITRMSASPFVQDEFLYLEFDALPSVAPTGLIMSLLTPFIA